MSDAEQKPECPKCMSLRNQRLNEEVLCTEHFKKAVALLAEHSKPTQAEAKPEVTENNLGKPVDGELESEIIHWLNEVQLAPKGKVYLTSFAIMQLFSAHTQAAAAAAEDRVIDIAHRKPCDCGSTEHFPTPVRSVTGSVTYFCQFSRIAPSGLQQLKQEGN